MKWNNDWNQIDADRLEATIDADRKTSECFDLPGESETQVCTNCKDVRASVNLLWPIGFLHHCDNDVVGTYTRDLDWNNMSWNINSTNSIDFDCCE